MSNFTYKKELFDFRNLVSNLNTKKEDYKLLLNSFDRQCLLFILSVMYIGRDCWNSEPFSKPEIEVKKKIRELDPIFSEDSFIINQIVQKTPLLKYLDDGIRILSIV